MLNARALHDALRASRSDRHSGGAKALGPKRRGNVVDALGVHTEVRVAGAALAANGNKPVLDLNLEVVDERLAPVEELGEVAGPAARVGLGFGLGFSLG